ncbi:hypothetical protein L6164_026218 [Bauhinia variegata]|uniref:Uncharacterized protein n=1 Tax=Bauhinia variegata TaxID=167791 RepID=A0ACB9LPM2_BAUVA|nr:hypothetical protein L6164_026218 [Bauhinia variegata]
MLQRLDIAIDVASALEYLHHGFETPIIHCDLKPSNVLLDDKLIGHVGDFGLARSFPEAARNYSAPQSSTNGVRGTIEYGMGNEVSISGDVYSFGILWLEIFTGKRPTDELFKDGMNLHIYVKEGLPMLIKKILDPILLKDLYNQRSRVVEECLISIFEVGLSCSDELPSERMRMEAAAAQLIAIKKKLLSGEK